jgi:hypothetical protein
MMIVMQDSALSHAARFAMQSLPKLGIKMKR